MMDVLERDCVENMLTLNNLAVYAVGLPVANRGWYFSGLAMRMATQMSLQKVDAPGRMPGASMMSGPGIESARRAFWTTLLLEALASFASGEPPPITIQDIHVAEPSDDPPMLNDEPPATSRGGGDDGLPQAAASLCASKCAPNVCAFTSQLSMFLIRVARLNGNRHPESAQFSPEYASLHTEMVAWYHALPDNMQIRATSACDEISRDPQLFAAKMFVHCHYHAAIIALHQPRVDLVRVESRDKKPAAPNGGDSQWRQLAQQQCLTAACTMTELLMLARALDVRYHIVTFGFAVFMAGVVHVGAVACTPRESNERQYSINCVKEHVRCLDRLGKYFAFHFIMAKHIRAQLHAIESADAKRQNLAAAALAEAMSSSRHSSQPAPPPPPPMLPTGTAGGCPVQPPLSMPFDFSAAMAMAPSLSQLAPTLVQPNSAPISGQFSFTANNNSVYGAAESAIPDDSQWLNNTQAQSTSQLDMFLGLFSAATSPPPTAPASNTPYSQQPPPPQQCPIPGSCGGLCGTHSPTTAASMAFQLHQSFSSMAGLGSGLSSLVELFSSNSDGSASLYPENILSSSMLAPANSAQQPGDLGLDRHAPPMRSTATAPTALLRFTSPGAGATLDTNKIRPSTQPPAQVGFSAKRFYGNRDTDDGEVRELVQRYLCRDCQAVRELATPDATAIRDMATKLAKTIATDLEARFSQAARGKGKGKGSNP
ncbi:hypothetical protein GGI21_003411, partial [Coemansia aciculifera]